MAEPRDPIEELASILNQTLGANALRLTSSRGGYVGGGQPHATLDSDPGAVEAIARGLLARRVGSSDPEAVGLDEYKEATDAAMNFGQGYHEGLQKAAQYLRVKAELTEKASPNAAYDLRRNADAIEHLSYPDPLHPLDAAIRDRL